MQRLLRCTDRQNTTAGSPDDDRTTHVYHTASPFPASHRTVCSSPPFPFCPQTHLFAAFLVRRTSPRKYLQFIHPTFTKHHLSLQHYRPHLRYIILAHHTLGLLFFLFIFPFSYTCVYLLRIVNPPPYPPRIDRRLCPRTRIASHTACACEHVSRRTLRCVHPTLLQFKSRRDNVFVFIAVVVEAKLVRS